MYGKTSKKIITWGAAGVIALVGTALHAATMDIAWMNISSGHVTVRGGGGTGQIFFDADASYVGPSTNLVGGYIGSGGDGWTGNAINPNSIMAFQMDPIVVIVYTAATNLGDADNPGSEQDPGVIPGGPVPSGVLDDVVGTIRMDLSSWFVNQLDADANQGTGKGGPTTSDFATGTWNPVTGAYTLTWQSQVPGGPFDGGSIGFWTISGVAVAVVPVPGALILFGSGLLGLLAFSARATQVQNRHDNLTTTEPRSDVGKAA